MAKIGLFYGTASNSTQSIAKIIKDKMGDEVDTYDASMSSARDIRKYDQLILGTATWDEDGRLDDLNILLNQLQDKDLNGKTVALFGLGDQRLYPEKFVNALGTAYRTLLRKGAKVVGQWPTNGYDFSHSTAKIGNHFVGLVLDEDNQGDLTEVRIDTWLNQVKNELIA